MHAFPKRGGKETQCSAYGKIRGDLVLEFMRCGTYSLISDFAAKWHCRINGYDLGSSEPSGSAAKRHHNITIMANARMLPNGIKSLRYESIGYNR
ncbi:hypothetical protein M5K25_022282 [Dendrobium thyrsiflorum]|uniref:Uncharacterized protein n=1 Tax=Dendrobium thyrsiflorum TaxID=117978 RepID=A0ABD0U622_DENTH